MADPVDALLDDLSPEKLALLEQELQTYRPPFLKHLVGLAGVYEHIGRNGDRKPQAPFCYSTTVIEIRGEWYLATAGHILEKMDALIRRDDARLVACGLDDTYAPTACHESPLSCFDYENAERFWHCDNTIDCGLIRLRQNNRDLLAANGIEPLLAQHWDPSYVASCDNFLMLGFPEDSIATGISFGNSKYNARVKGRPSLILVDRQNEEVGGDSSRFVGQIRPEHNVGSIVGMSGGPIFAFRGSEFEPYFLAAIQSTWLENDKVTFGCPIPLILDTAREFLAETGAV